MRITVVGDALLDEDVTATSTRRTPDGDAPVLDVERRVSRAGGAGLVAALLAGDGHDVRLVTALSSDPPSAMLMRRLASVDVVAAALAGPTTVKTRFAVDGRPFCRVDDGGRGPIPFGGAERLVAAIAEADAIVVADYGRGVAAHPAIRAALQARGARVPLVWDPHPRGAVPVSSAALVTPNRQEALAATASIDRGPRLLCAELAPSYPALAERAALLRHHWGCSAVAVTVGADGAILHDGGAPAFVPAEPGDEGADPCGAGDRFAATAATVLAGGGSTLAAVREAVREASAYVASGGVARFAERGSAPCTGDAGSGSAAGCAGGTEPASSPTRVRVGTVVATGGCFDIVHAGHVRTLEAARSLGDRLVVCVNSDASVRRLKGPERPILPQEDRVELLRALACVDEVVVFDEDGPEAVLDRIRPDVWVKGGDYDVDSLPESRLVESWGGRVLALPYHFGRSTTRFASALARVG